VLDLGRCQPPTRRSARSLELQGVAADHDVLGLKNIAILSANRHHGLAGFDISSRDRHQISNLPIRDKLHGLARAVPGLHLDPIAVDTLDRSGQIHDLGCATCIPSACAGGSAPFGKELLCCLLVLISACTTARLGAGAKPKGHH